MAVRAGGFCVAPQAGPKIRALGAPLGHCERRPGATGPFQWPKKDRLRQQRTGACCCAVARGPRPGGPALLCRTRQPGTARRSPRFSCKALFGPLLGLSGRAARRVVARFSELRGRSGAWLKARPKPFQGQKIVFFLGRTRFRIHGAFCPKMWENSPQCWSSKPLADWEPTRG